MLILDDGATVYEFRLILEWLEIKHPRPPLFPEDPDELLAAKRLEVLADGVCNAFVLLFWERRRPEAQQSEPWMARQTRKIEGGLKEVARLVPPGSRYFVGDRFGLGNLAVGAMPGFLLVRFPELDCASTYPHLAELYERLSERPCFAATVPMPQPTAPDIVRGVLAVLCLSWSWHATGWPSSGLGKLAVENLTAGEPLIVDDNPRELASEQAATLQNIGIAATIRMPLVKEERLTALMAIHDRVPCVWTHQELSLLGDVAARSRSHVEWARGVRMSIWEMLHPDDLEEIRAGLALIGGKAV